MRGSSVSGKASRLAAFSWILYDFSNTIFSVTVLSFFFPLWVEERVGSGGFLSGAGLVNSATAVSALLVVLTAPVLGAIADLRQRRVPYLILLTVVAVALTAALDVAGGVVVGLSLFVAADLSYQSALVFYNSLLPVVSAGGRQGQRIRHRGRLRRHHPRPRRTDVLRGQRRDGAPTARTSGRMARDRRRSLLQRLPADGRHLPALLP